jgi:esterase/lipase superfamily enzyme
MLTPDDPSRTALSLARIYILRALHEAQSLSIAALFAIVRRLIGSRADLSDETLQQALTACQDQGLLAIEGTTVIRKTKRRAALKKMTLPEMPEYLEYLSEFPRYAEGHAHAQPSERRARSDAGGSIEKPRARRSYRGAPNEVHEVGVFYATNRERATLTPRARYTDSGMPASIDRGHAVVTFPPYHRRGLIEEPARFNLIARLNPDQYGTVIQSVDRLATAQFHKKLRVELDRYANGIFVFVHGFNTSFDMAIKRTAQLALDTNFQGTAIAFSWCSCARLSARAYLSDLDAVDASARALGDFLEELRAHHDQTSIHVVAHSMGARIAGKAVESLSGTQSIGEIALQAPDISVLDYPTFAAALTARSCRVTVYASASDAALRGSKIIRLTGDRVGRDVHIAIEPGVEAIDATGMTGGHGCVFRKPLVIDLRSVLDGHPQVRVQLEARTYHGSVYYAFRETE